jgi:FkbM family methyltransferase
MMRLETERHLTVRYRGMTLRLDLNQYPSQEMYWLGSWEPRDVSLLEGRLAPGMVVVDAGANVGILTCTLAAIVGEQGVVHAFEPDPSSFALLVENVEGNRLESRVALNQLALGHRVGHATIECAGASSFVGRGSVPIRMITLDAYAEGFDRLDFVKIDVEGYEPLLLQGAEGTLRRLRPLLLVECAERVLGRNGASSASLRRQLSGLGYRIVETGRENLLCEPG